jgi:hypothetical protein
MKPTAFGAPVSAPGANPTGCSIRFCGKGMNGNGIWENQKPHALAEHYLGFCLSEE